MRRCSTVGELRRRQRRATHAGRVSPTVLPARGEGHGRSEFASLPGAWRQSRVLVGVRNAVRSRRHLPPSAVTCTWQNAGEQLDRPMNCCMRISDVEAEVGGVARPGGKRSAASPVAKVSCHQVALRARNSGQANCDPHEEGVTNGEFEGHASGVPVPPVSQTQAVTIGEGATPFGVSTTTRLALEDEGGAPLTRRRVRTRISSRRRWR